VALTTYAGVTALASAVKPLAAVAIVPPAVYARAVTVL
jgi:hypothetical protein